MLVQVHSVPSITLYYRKTRDSEHTKNIQCTPDKDTKDYVQ